MLSKPKLKKADLAHRDDIWNAVISVLTEHKYPAENTAAKEANTLLQYYSELESGGHESLLRWNSDYISEAGMGSYLKELICALEQINAHEYAKIEERYGMDMWNLYMSLENDEIEEDDFYRIIERADKEYNNLDGKLEKLLETYFIRIHKDLIDVVDD